MLNIYELKKTLKFWMKIILLYLNYGYQIGGNLFPFPIMLVLY
jgi:hypothetical protein